MSKILVKGIILYGQSSDWDNHPGPTDLDALKTYRTTDKFLIKNGQPIVPEMIDHLPFIEEGIITPSVSVSLYAINNCLITNRTNPYFNMIHGAHIVHIIQGVSRIEDKLKIDETLDFLKINAGRFKYWRNYENEEIINVPEQLSDINKLIAYVPKLVESLDNTLILPKM